MDQAPYRAPYSLYEVRRNGRSTAAISAAIQYVVAEQGQAMAVFQSHEA
jgi:hypothetical protein